MKETKNATFIQRLIALVIDLVIIMLVSSIFTAFTVDMDNYQKLSDELVSVEKQLEKEEITPTVYMSKSMDINYDLSRETALTTIVTIALSIVYFMIYQVKKNGQTLGKKLMKIRLVSNDEKDLTMNQVAVRSLIINCVLADILLLTLVLICTKNIYMIGAVIIEMIQYIVFFIIAIMVLSRKDKRGLHDLITNTKVIKEV